MWFSKEGRCEPILRLLTSSSGRPSCSAAMSKLASFSFSSSSKFDPPSMREDAVGPFTLTLPIAEALPGPPATPRAFSFVTSDSRPSRNISAAACCDAGSWTIISLSRSLTWDGAA